MALLGKTVLVVDDSSDDRFLMERAVRKMASGVCVQFAASGDEAVAYLEGSGAYADRLRFPYPAFVITDLNMQQGDGFEVLRCLRSKAPAHTPVMMLTSSDEPEHRRRALDLGASSYCIKPQSANAFVPLISTFLLAEAKSDGLEPMRRA